METWLWEGRKQAIASLFTRAFEMGGTLCIMRRCGNSNRLSYAMHDSRSDSNLSSNFSSHFSQSKQLGRYQMFPAPGV